MARVHERGQSRDAEGDDMRLAHVLMIAAALAASALLVARAGDMPAVGDEAPDFTLQNGAGDDVTLSALRGESAVLLAFYPKDFSPG